MRWLALAALIPSVALAQPVQQPQSPPLPIVQALQQRVIQLTGESLDWQTQAITLQRQVDGLQKQLADAKATKEPPKP